MKKCNLLLLVTVALAILTQPSKQTYYGSTCLSVNSLCVYNYNCQSTCCSTLTKRCKTLYSGEYKTDSRICYLSPYTYPSQPYCGINSRRVSRGSSGFFGVVIAIPCVGCILCFAAIYFAYKKCYKKNDSHGKTVIIH